VQSEADWAPLSDADLRGIATRLKRVAFVVGLALIVALPVTAHFVGDDRIGEQPDAESVLLRAYPRGAVERLSCQDDGGVIARCSYSIGSRRCTARVPVPPTYGSPIVKC
jgi:hypothetical protein